MPIKKFHIFLDYNQLTGVLNEIRFNTLLETNFLKDQDITIINLTITNLNELTYSHGKEIYAAILRSIAEFLEGITKERDLIGLSSNNDFLIATEGIHKEESQLICQMINFFDKPLVLDLFTVIIKYKIGIAYYPLQTESYSELLQMSRLAITPVINNVLINVSHYDQSIMDKILHENAIKNEIETALEAREFVLYYQPKYANDGTTMLGLEALIRWQQKDGSLKSPGYFIDIAEQSGQIINIGFYVIERVCQSIVEYNLVNREMPVSINFSGQHFASRDILYKLLDAVNRYHIPPHLLEIEITETALITNKEYGAAILSELRELGFLVTLDDFGTGYASIDYIKNLPIDRLKIDQSYAKRLEDIKSRKLLKTMIQMAHELSFEVTVEGVETREQFEIIKTFEPKEFQGYYFKRPVPLTELFKTNE
ncbi:GGDEF domain-containing phosphodiesterase [Acetobacterium wieringae]|uniref:GGDEF domain-containing phosphodiesterase n=1 Tax=Acetobacterium wieringae TaxID=52694 RepID=UPI002B1F7E5A|nr:GGDEF domain-containing phosphodiesterase [Acetobacterium wieringae]MEA4806931.1 GGDEF domain-containing phosphodiesterase [Acetobacterium wieringae]